MAGKRVGGLTDPGFIASGVTIPPKPPVTGLYAGFPGTGPVGATCGRCGQFCKRIKERNAKEDPFGWCLLAHTQRGTPLNPAKLENAKTKDRIGSRTAACNKFATRKPEDH